MKALIIEDEIYNFDCLKRMLLRAYPQTEIEGPITNLIDLERAMSSLQCYDVIYCDIRLEDGVCFSVFDDTDVTVPIIFTTAYSEFALKAFEANGIAYLLKPIGLEALKKATDKALSFGRANQNIVAMLESIRKNGHLSYQHYLKANTYDGSYIIDISNVNHFVSDKKKSYAIMADGTKHHIDYSLEQLTHRLNPLMFFRSNRQYIVNRHAIHRLQTYGNRQMLLILTDYNSTHVLVSKENVAVLNKWIEQ